VRSHVRCIILPEETHVTQDRLVTLMGRYDNDWGFSNRLVDMVKRMVPAAVSNGTSSR